jgi:hypothetical protein
MPPRLSPEELDARIKGLRESINFWKGLQASQQRSLKGYTAEHAHAKKQVARYTEHAKKARAPETKNGLRAMAAQHRARVAHMTTAIRSSRNHGRDYDRMIGDLNASVKLDLVRKREYNQSARKIQAAYRSASASPYTQLGRQRILRNGGFDPTQHRALVVNGQRKKSPPRQRKI